MALIPAVCDSCNTIWGTRNLISGNAANLTLTGNKVSPCPKCGGWGNIPDGVYELQNDILKVISTTEIEAGSLQQLINLLEALQRGEVSSAEVNRAVERDVPTLAPTFKRALGTSDPVKWASLLIAIIALYLQGTATAPPSADEVAKAIRAEPIPMYPAPLNSAPDRSPSTKPKKERKRRSKSNGRNKRRKARKRR